MVDRSSRGWAGELIAKSSSLMASAHSIDHRPLASGIRPIATIGRQLGRRRGARPDCNSLGRIEAETFEPSTQEGTEIDVVPGPPTVLLETELSQAGDDLGAHFVARPGNGGAEHGSQVVGKDAVFD